MTQKFDLHQTITNQIITAIEAGANGGQWELPWVGRQAGLPFNPVTGNRYSGVNVLMLWGTGNREGYPTNEWASYKQWAKRGCQVRKGEQGTMVVFTKRVTKKDANGETDPENSYGFLRYYRVFNAAQVDGWDSPEVQMPSEAERIEAAEDFVVNTGADIRYQPGGAFYVPSRDYVQMPLWQSFKPTMASTATENAYSTLLHELTHWTGHEKRCDRQFGKRFGDNAYAMEELVAELGAAFLCAHLGIAKTPRQDHAQYIEHWLSVLKADKKAIFTAAAKASQAVDFLDSLQFDDGEPGQMPGQPAEGDVILLPAPEPLPALPAPAPLVAQEPETEEPEALPANLVEPIEDEAEEDEGLPEPGGLLRRQAIGYARFLAERDGLADDIEFAAPSPVWDGKAGRYRSVIFEDEGNRLLITLPRQADTLAA